MAVIGLLGDEYDSCTGILKARLEDDGHTARVVNLRHLPRVTRATIDSHRIVCDGYNLFEMDCFYLREMGARDPFFHVTYTRELWEMLRERYLAFAAAEEENVRYAHGVLHALALRKPVVNPPHVYLYRRLIPFQLASLAAKGFTVLPFEIESGESAPTGEPLEELALDLDEETACDVLTFPKGREKGLRIRRKSIGGRVFTLIVIGGRIIDAALSASERGVRPAKIGLAELPPEVTDTACRAAAAIEATFARVDLCFPKDRGTVWLLKIDPSPDFYELESEYKLDISKPLARHLVKVARDASS